ncbi:hypothetical protein [Nocardioides convexus]|uniref:hypothetical protein n=1 Tax=Nocardioides convexus TaxID=2712224 RepID=UPI0024189506|nr:hypothetical protein [Nocardioides convexus]
MTRDAGGCTVFPPPRSTPALRAPAGARLGTTGAIMTACPGRRGELLRPVRAAVACRPGRR